MKLEEYLSQISSIKFRSLKENAYPEGVTFPKRRLGRSEDAIGGDFGSTALFKGSSPSYKEKNLL